MKIRIAVFFILLCLATMAQGLLNVDEVLLDAKDVTTSKFPDADYAIVDNQIHLEYRDGKDCDWGTKHLGELKKRT